MEPHRRRTVAPARAMLRFTQAKMATALHITPSTLKRLERQTGPLLVAPELAETLRISLIDLGIELIPSGSYVGIAGPGVRLIGMRSMSQSWTQSSPPRTETLRTKFRSLHDFQA